MSTKLLATTRKIVTKVKNYVKIRQNYASSACQRRSSYLPYLPAGRSVLGKNFSRGLVLKTTGMAFSRRTDQGRQITCLFSFLTVLKATFVLNFNQSQLGLRV